MCYYAHIDSILNYCSAAFIYLSFYLQEQIRKLANRAHSIICYKFCNDSRIPDPTKRKVDAAVKLFMNAKVNPKHILHNIMPHTLPPSKKLFVHHSNTSQRIQQLLPHCVQILNSTIIVFNHSFHQAISYIHHCVMTTSFHHPASFCWIIFSFYNFLMYECVIMAEFLLCIFWKYYYHYYNNWTIHEEAWWYLKRTFNGQISG